MATRSIWCPWVLVSPKSAAFHSLLSTSLTSTASQHHHLDHGKGKRTGLYGAYLLACYDNDTEEFQSVCKIGTGFSEEDLKTLAADLKDHVIPEKSSQYVVSDTLACDVWFDAVRVWEVKAADLSKSSTHKGAIDKTGDAGRGIGLRFPRFERVRPDKKPEQATSSDQILEMYYNQDSVIDKGGGGDDDGI